MVPYSLSSDNADMLGKMTTSILLQIVKFHHFFCCTDPSLMHMYLYRCICVFWKCKGVYRHEGSVYIHVPTSPHCEVCRHCCNLRSDLLTSHCAGEITGIHTAASKSQVGGKNKQRGGEKCSKMLLNFHYGNSFIC